MFSPVFPKAHYLVNIGGHVGGTAMQVEQGLRARAIGGNPPTCKLAASERKPDVLKSHAQIGRVLSTIELGWKMNLACVYQMAPTMTRYRPAIPAMITRPTHAKDLFRGYIPVPLHGTD